VAGAGHDPDEPPNARATAVCAQRIRAAAVSGCSPYSCATCAAHPVRPSTLVAVAIACLTCAALGSSERCSTEANSAAARSAAGLRS
jgi:hypothetical protein